MHDVQYVTGVLRRFPLFLIRGLLWTALLLAVIPLYLCCVMCLLPEKRLASAVQRHPVMLAHFLAGVREDVARVHAEYRELLGWLTMR